MKRFLLFWIIIPVCLSGNAQDFAGKLVALYQFPIDFSIQNDQGEMGTKDYLKNYGTKRKTRALEYMYGVMLPFINELFAEKGVSLMPCDELRAVKANPYGVPNMLISKALKNCDKADYFLRIALKDITVINPTAQQTDLSIKMRTITVRCRITVTDEDKNMIKELEAKFNSGQKIDPDVNLGFDIRKISGPERDQEIKVYESCCKMAFFKALEKW